MTLQRLGERIDANWRCDEHPADQQAVRRAVSRRQFCAASRTLPVTEGGFSTASTTEVRRRRSGSQV